MNENHSNNNVMSDAFNAMRKDVPQPSEPLLARVLADANRVQAERARTAKPTATRHWLRELTRALGGWPSMAGLATATVAGLGLGIFPPGDLPEMTGVFLGLNDAGYLMDLSPDFAFGLAEETL